MNGDSWIQVETGISQAYWCKLRDERHALFAKAEIEQFGTTRTVSWLDEMFYGGIRFPLVSDRPATFLLTGPPGSGEVFLKIY